MKKKNGGGLRHPTGTTPLAPSYFRIEEPSLKWLASESGSQKSGLESESVRKNIPSRRSVHYLFRIQNRLYLKIKVAQKKIHEHKNPLQNIVHLLRGKTIFFLSVILHRNLLCKAIYVSLSHSTLCSTLCVVFTVFPFYSFHVCAQDICFSSFTYLRAPYLILHVYFPTPLSFLACHRTSTASPGRFPSYLLL